MEQCYNLQTCAANSSLEQDIRLCADVGFSSVEIDFQKARNYLQEHTLQDLSRLMQAHRMRCASINAIFSINFCTEQQWEDVCAQLDFACDLGEAAGADRVIVLSNERADLPAGVTDEAVFTDTLQALHRLADRGGARGMKLSLIHICTADQIHPFPHTADRAGSARPCRPPPQCG